MGFEPNFPIPNTMACPGVARLGAFAGNRAALETLTFQALEMGEYPRVLGQGSNLLVPDFVDAIVIVAKGGEITQSGRTLKVDAGVGWQQLVDYSLEQGLRGLENLTAIPGSVGAAPVQNIGAYGVEVSEFIRAVEIIDFESKQIRLLSPDECKFDYRESVFKQQLDGKAAIISVEFELSEDRPFSLSYGPLQALVDQEGLTPQQVANRVAEIRWSKLPNPDQVPNSGSFFKNPVVSRSWLESRQAKGDIDFGPVFEMAEHVKLSAGWLIDQCDFKAEEIEGCRVYQKHALVVTNPNHRLLSDVLALAKAIKRRIKEVYGVSLEIEPRMLAK